MSLIRSSRSLLRLAALNVLSHTSSKSTFIPGHIRFILLHGQSGLRTLDNLNTLFQTLISDGNTFVSFPQATAILSGSANSETLSKSYISVTIDDGLSNSYYFLRRLQELHIPFHQFLCPAFFDPTLNIPFAELYTRLGQQPSFLSREEVIPFLDNPANTIGSHTLSHMLATDQSLPHFVQDISSAKSLLQTNLNCVVNSFAWTRGQMHHIPKTHLKHAVFSSEYKYICSGLRGVHKVGNPFVNRIIRRNSIDLNINPQSSLYFLSGSFLSHFSNLSYS